MSIGKFAILATYSSTPTTPRRPGHDQDKQRGLVAAVMGAKAKLRRAAPPTSMPTGLTEKHDEGERVRRSPRRSFDRQGADKLAGLFREGNPPAVNTLVRARFILMRK